METEALKAVGGRQSLPRQESSVLLFADIVEFSQFSSTKQGRLIRNLNRMVRDLLESAAAPKGSVITVPTGDGLAVAFLDGALTGRQAKDLSLSLVAALISWAEFESNNQGDPLLLRLGLNHGSVTLIEDINQLPNFVGDVVNMTARAMNAADPGQILLHRDFANHFLGREPSLALTSTALPGGATPIHLTLEALEETVIPIKHGHTIVVRPARLRINQRNFRRHRRLGPPESALQLTVTVSEHGKPIGAPSPTGHEGRKSNPSVLRRMGSAHSLALIQLTGHRLIQAWEKDDLTLANDLKRLWVFMPEPKGAAASMEPPEAKLRIPQLAVWIARWREKLLEWRSEHPDCDVRLGLFRNPPYLGASFLDWDQQGGFIQVSPHVWGRKATLCPGFELEWRGRRQPAPYESYVQGLLDLYRSAGNALDEEVY